MNGTISGSIAVGYTLSVDPTTILDTGTVAVTAGNAIYGGAASAWSVLNSGLVQGAATGVSLAGGGTVSNAAGATIAGARAAIAISSGVGSVYNAGSLVATGGSIITGIGVGLYAGGSVTNASAASITGDGIGVYVSTGGTVVNSGGITATAANGAGVEVSDGDAVTNTASASIAGGSDGVFFLSGGATGSNLVNDGSIAGTGAHGCGVFLQYGGLVTNESSGTITGAYGVQVDGATTVVNYGRIAGTGASAVYLVFGGSVSNAASGMVSGSGQGVKIIGGAGTVVNDGGIVAGASGVYLGSGGTVTNAASASITGSVGAYLFGGSTLTNAGSIVGTGGTAVAFAGTGSNLLVLDPGYGFSGLVRGSASAANTLELASAASAGSVAGLGTGIVNFGSITFGAGARWSIAGNTAGLAGTISGFALGDTIEVTGVTEQTTSFSGGVLTLHEAVGSATLDLPGSFTSATNFDVAPNSDGTEVTVACFAAGARLLTVAGEVAVEVLEPGDLVVTRSGRVRRVQWIGRRRVEPARHPRPREVWPVRIRTDAFAPGVPHRDLLLSPDHAVAWEDVLIPVRYLCNSVTIRHEATATIVYYHVELDAHDIVLAEGLPAESFLDTGNRCAFANGGTPGDDEGAAPVQAHPDFAPWVWEALTCAPLMVSGPVVAAAQRYLLGRAMALGWGRGELPDYAQARSIQVT